MFGPLNLPFTKYSKQSLTCCSLHWLLRQAVAIISPQFADFSPRPTSECDGRCLHMHLADCLTLVCDAPPAEVLQTPVPAVWLRLGEAPAASVAAVPFYFRHRVMTNDSKWPAVFIAPSTQTVM